MIFDSNGISQKIDLYYRVFKRLSLKSQAPLIYALVKNPQMIAGTNDGLSNY